jgi:phosphate uptake regulator
MVFGGKSEEIDAKVVKIEEEILSLRTTLSYPTPFSLSLITTASFSLPTQFSVLASSPFC